MMTNITLVLGINYFDRSSLTFDLIRIVKSFNRLFRSCCEYDLHFIPSYSERYAIAAARSSGCRFSIMSVAARSSISARRLSRGRPPLLF